MHPIIFIMLFTNKLIAWYIQNKRNLPWRETSDPYIIWLSEIILQQTRVAQGLPYFEKFTHDYPTVFQLANASEDHVMRNWQGLGYYNRARNLHETAKKVAFELGGEFPSNYKDLQKLKGVGTYTAAAIASIAFGENIPVVDGNVYRVLSRVFGITTDISSGKAFKIFQEKAQSLIDPTQPDLFNQAIMDFGAIHCTPKKPLCNECIFSKECIAFQTNEVLSLPIKLTKTKVKKRFLDFIIFQDKNNNTYIEQRNEQDIWQKLYQFPLFESFDNPIENIHLKVAEVYKETPYTTITLLNSEPIIHLLSHQKLHINFWQVDLKIALEKATPWKDLNKFAFPIVIHNFIQQILEKNERHT